MKRIYFIMQFAFCILNISFAQEYTPYQLIGDIKDFNFGLALEVNSTTLSSRPCPNQTDVQRAANDLVTPPQLGDCYFSTTQKKQLNFDGTAWTGSSSKIAPFKPNYDYKKDDLIIRNRDLYIVVADYTSSADFNTDLSDAKLYWFSPTDTVGGIAVAPTVNKTAANTVNIGAGKGFIADPFTSAGQRTFVRLDWTASDVAIPANPSSYFYIRINADLTKEVLMRSPTVRDYQDDLIVAKGYVGQDGIVFSVNQHGWIGFLVDSKVQDSAINDGILNLHGGNQISSVAGTLNISRSAGDIFSIGIDPADPRNPNSRTTNAVNPASWFYATSTDLDTAVQSNLINPNQYQPAGAGALKTVTNNRWTTQRIYISTFGTLVVMYGQKEYISQSDALADVKVTPVIPNPIAADPNAFLWTGYIIVLKGATNLADTTQALVANCGKYGCEGAGASVTGAVNGDLFGPTTSTKGSVPNFSDTTGKITEDKKLILLDGSNGNTPAAYTSAVDFFIGRQAGGALANANQTAADLSFEYGGGGFKHYITTTHNAAANSFGNSFRFYLNNGALAADSSAPGTNNTLVMQVTQQGVGILTPTTEKPIGALDVLGNIYTSFHGNASQHSPTEIGARRIGHASGNAGAEFTGMQLNVSATRSDGTVGFANSSNIGFYTWGNGISVTREVARITEYGWLGIGTTNPKAQIEVAGTPIPIIRANGNTDNQQAGTLFLSQGDIFGYKISYDATNTHDGLRITERRNNVETINMSIGQGKTHIGIHTAQNIIDNAGNLTLNLVGPSNSMNGPSMSFNNNEDIHPIRQFLNWSHDNIWDCFDCYWDGANYRNSNASSAFRWTKTATDLTLSSVPNPTAGGIEASSNIAWWNESGSFNLSRPAWATGQGYDWGGAYFFMNTQRGQSGGWASMVISGGNSDNQQEFYNQNGGWGWQAAFRIRTASPPDVYFLGPISASAVTNRSSRVLKKDISPLDDNVVDKFKLLKPVKYRLKDKPYLGRKIGEPLTDREKETKWRFGFIIEELMEVFPDMASNEEEQEIVDYEDGVAKLIKKKVRGYDSTEIISLLVKVVQEQEKRIEELEKKLNGFQNPSQYPAKKSKKSTIMKKSLVEKINKCCTPNCEIKADKTQLEMQNEYLKEKMEKLERDLNSQKQINWWIRH